MTLCNYSSYILNDSNMMSYLKYNKKEEITNPIVVEPIIAKPIIVKTNMQSNPYYPFVIPKEHDTLFWCYYSNQHQFDYETMVHRTILAEKQLKIQYVSIIREKKVILKPYKFDSIVNFEHNLVNDNMLNISTFMALCVIHNINVLYINNKTYFQLNVDDSEDVWIVKTFSSYDVINNNNNTKNNNNNNTIIRKYEKRYGIYITTQQNALEYTKQLYKLDVLNKPLKSISAYKVSELVTIAQQLDISIESSKQSGKKKTKPELYESLVQYFSSDY